MRHVISSEARSGSRRRSLRLQHYDYASAGCYFVTICTYRRLWLFGAVRDGRISLNALGVIAWEEMLRTPARRPNVRIDTFNVMPDHVHAVIAIDEAAPGVRDRRAYVNTPLRSPSQTLGAIVRGYKAAAAARINAARRGQGNPVWERSYYDRGIRNEKELGAVREYIVWNGLKVPGASNGLDDQDGI